MNGKKTGIGARLCALFAVTAFFAAAVFALSAREAGAGAAFRGGGTVPMKMEIPEPTSPDINEK